MRGKCRKWRGEEGMRKGNKKRRRQKGKKGKEKKRGDQ